MDEAIGCGYQWFIAHSTMTDPKNPEAKNEELINAQSELSDEELEGLAGGIMLPGGGVGLHEDGDHDLDEDHNDIGLKMKKKIGSTSGPGGTSY